VLIAAKAYFKQLRTGSLMAAADNSQRHQVRKMPSWPRSWANFSPL
jgi:hypothetical protein